MVKRSPTDVPLSRLRPHALALTIGLLLLVGLWLLPDLSPPPEPTLPEIELVRARLIAVEPPGTDPTKPDARVEILSGPREGTVTVAWLQGPTGSQETPRFDVGDEVIVGISPEPDGEFVAVNDLWRMPTIALLLGIFAVAVTVVGGWRGVRSLLGLALTLAVITRVVVPLILAGWNPLWVAVAAASGVTAVTFVLTEGARRSTAAAALGTFVALALAGTLASVFNAAARFSPLQGSEELAFLQTIVRPDLDLGGLLFAAIIFGALGILDDVTITQAATVQELFDADPRASRLDLARRAMNVGRSHIAATVNTLVLAYVGASLPLIVLFAAGHQDPLLIASQEIVAVEIIRALVGSIGIVAAVPITTAVAVLLAGRALPVVGDGSGRIVARGWD